MRSRWPTSWIANQFNGLKIDNHNANAKQSIKNNWKNIKWKWLLLLFHAGGEDKGPWLNMIPNFYWFYLLFSSLELHISQWKQQHYSKRLHTNRVYHRPLFLWFDRLFVFIAKHLKEASVCFHENENSSRWNRIWKL